MTRHVILYSKPGCHLCEHVREDLRELEAALAIWVEEVDITSDERLFERYRYLIPVVDIDDGVVLYAPITRSLLREALD